MKTKNEYISVLISPDYDVPLTDVDTWLEKSLGPRGGKWQQYRPGDAGIRVVMIYEFSDLRYKTLFDLTWSGVYTVYSTPGDAREGYLHRVNEKVRQLTKGL